MLSLARELELVSGFDYSKLINQTHMHSEKDTESKIQQSQEAHSTKPKKRVLVIGGGPAGLSTVKAFKELPDADQYSVTCIEKQNDWSGQWNYSWRTCVNEYGQSVHSSMYSQLWTNVQKECFEFPDYTWKEHFNGKATPSYLPRDVYKSYFMTRLQKADVKKFVRLNQVVRNVKFLPSTMSHPQEQFEARINDLTNNTDSIERFDFVVVAVGHFAVPNFPTFPGIEKFTGTITHSHDVREFHSYKGKNVLVIGGSLSGEDLALQCYKFGARLVIWTYRRLKFPIKTQNTPKEIEMRSLAVDYDGQYAIFQNGDKKQVDHIILCTGYIHSFPFLEEDLKLKTPHNAPFPPNLYKSVALFQNPKVLYIGMGDYKINHIIYDIQAHLIRDIITGKHSVPTDENLLRHDSVDEELKEEITQSKCTRDFLTVMCKYARHLMTLTGYHENWEIEDLVDMFAQNAQDRSENIVTYRDKDGFKSLITGQASCKGNLPWLEVMDGQISNGGLQKNLELKKFFEF